MPNVPQGPSGVTRLLDAVHDALKLGCLAALLLTFGHASTARAQKTEDDLRARLVKHSLYLRGQWGNDALAFDSAGRLVGTAPFVSFTLSGMDVKSVKLNASGLVLKGQRVGIEFKKDTLQRVDLKLPDGLFSPRAEQMTVEIQRPADGDFTAALDAIFTEDPADFKPTLPEYWRPFFLEHFPGVISAAAPPAVSGSKAPSQIARVGGGVTAPQFLTTAEPEFNDSARALRYSGIVLLSLIVDEAGKPSRIRILHPLGLGLDDRAVAAAGRYTFKPATRDGSPVAVQINMEVNFQIY